MRAVVQSGSEEGRAVQAYVTSGNLVPKELVASILLKNLSVLDTHTVLIDGFPRSTDQAVLLEQMGLPVDFMLHVDTSQEDELINRLIERGKTSGRADDKEETIKYRFSVYKSESLPVLSLYEPFGIVRKVDCLGKITEVTDRIIKALRPELFFVSGVFASGKSSLAKTWGEQHEMHYVKLSEIKGYRRYSSSYTYDDEREVAVALVNYLQSLKHERRVIVDGFPESAHQARIFASIFGEPNKIVHLTCAQDVAYQRIPNSKAYAQSALRAKEVTGYYAKKHPEGLFQLETSRLTAASTYEHVKGFLLPEAVLLKGEASAPIVLHFVNKGYYPVNASQLLMLWRKARAVSQSKELTKLSDDPEIIDILKRRIFSGLGHTKFVIYNFARWSSEILSRFESQIAELSKVIYVKNEYFSLVPDQAMEYAQATLRLQVVHSNPIDWSSSNLTPEFDSLLDLTFNENKQVGKLVVVLGPRKSGKTTVCKHLVERLGFKLVDFEAVVEATKAMLSTEDEPKESLTITELAGGIAAYLTKYPAKYVMDGLPPAEILFAAGDSQFADYEEEESEAQSVEANPAILAKLSETCRRLSRILVRGPLSKLLLSVIRLDCSRAALEQRLKAELELSAEDEIPADEQGTLQESLILSELLQKIPLPTSTIQTKTKWVYDLDSSELDLPRLKALLTNEFERKLILVKAKEEGEISAIRRLCWLENLHFIDFRWLEIEGRQDLHFREVLARCPVTECKFDLLRWGLDKSPSRDKYLVLNQFPFDLNDFGSILEDFAALERLVGSLHALVEFYPHTAETYEIHPLPVRHPVPKNEEEAEDRDADDENPPPAAEPQEEIGMWNDSRSSSLTQLFFNYCGRNPELVRMSIDGDFDGLHRGLARLLHERCLFQIQANDSMLMKLELKLGGLPMHPCDELNEFLPVDTTELGSQLRPHSEILWNGRAQDFYSKHMKQYSVPFSVFFEGLTQYLAVEGFVPSEQLRKAVREVVDSNHNFCIDVEEVNNFFELWLVDKNRFLSAASRPSKHKMKASYSLVIGVVQHCPDPNTRASSFQIGQTFEITSEGCPGSSRFCADSVTYFGKANKLVANDVTFSRSDTRIKNSLFYVLSKPSGYFFVDTGLTDEVKAKVGEYPIALFPGAVIQFAQAKCVVKTCRAPKLADFGQVLNWAYKGSRGQAIGKPLLVLEFIEGSLRGSKVTLKSNSPGENTVDIGSHESNYIVLQDGCSVRHAVIELTDAGWTLMDMYSTGTWIYFNTYNSMLAHKPAAPVKLTHGLEIIVPGTVFKVAFKSTEDFKFEVSGMINVHNEPFALRYELTDSFGEGGLSNVRRCVNRLTKRVYAVKIVKKAADSQRLLAEFSVLRGLDHPNVLRVLDIVIDQGIVHLVTEACTGGELLMRVIKQQTFTEAQVSGIMRQIISALAYLHSKGIVHRDLNPGNILFESEKPDSPIKLIDFSEAKFNPLSKLSGVHGSPHYLAPEVLKGEYDAKVDVWAAGVLMYTLLCGSPPFGGKTEDEVLKKIEVGFTGFKGKGWQTVSIEAKALITKMLTLEPARRAGAAELLQSSWMQNTLKYVSLENPLTARALKSLKAFNSSCKLQSAVLVFLAEQVASEEDQRVARELFESLDKNSDGKLSSAELIKLVSTGALDVDTAAANELITRLDADFNGTIEPAEFLAGMVEHHRMVAKEQLQRTFEKFDEDGSGAITSEELKRILGSGNEQWQTVIDQIDQNGDGKIDIKEFKNLMMNLGS
jgi:calcium-dependent protein kinase